MAARDVFPVQEQSHPFAELCKAGSVALALGVLAIAGYAIHDLAGQERRIRGSVATTALVQLGRAENLGEDRVTILGTASSDVVRLPPFATAESLRHHPSIMEFEFGMAAAYAETLRRHLSAGRKASRDEYDGGRISIRPGRSVLARGAEEYVEYSALVETLEGRSAAFYGVAVRGRRLVHGPAIHDYNIVLDTATNRNYDPPAAQAAEAALGISAPRDLVGPTNEAKHRADREVVLHGEGEVAPSR